MSVFQIIPFVAYVAVAHPATYKLTRKVLGDWIANAEGLATLPGLALHAVVFVLLVSLLMNFIVPSISKASMMSPPAPGPKSESEMAMARLLGRA
jgi:hypothetical protein